MLEQRPRAGKSLSSYLTIRDFFLLNPDKKMVFMSLRDNEFFIENTLKELFSLHVNVEKSSSFNYTISLKKYKGRNYSVYKKIESVERVIDLANHGKAVYYKLWDKTKPAAFMVSMQARLLHRYIKDNDLFEIIKLN